MKENKKLPLKISIILLGILLFATSCSLRIMYNRLDWIIPIYLNDYVSLTDQQEDFFDPAISLFLAWHRNKELPRYIQFVVALRKAQTHPMNRQQVLVFFAGAEALWTELLQQALPALLELAATLEDFQIQEIDDALQHKIRKLQKKYRKKSQSDRRAAAADKMTDSMQDLLGDLTDDQEVLIKIWSATKKDNTEDWLIFRDSWRQSFIELLRQPQDPHYFDELRLLLLKPERLYSIAHRQAIRENRQLLAQLVADLSETLSSEQRAHLQQKLNEIIGELQALHN